jgi:ankyrin repeat protein
MRAAGQTNNPGVLLALIKAGADLEAIDKGVSPLNLWRRANGSQPNSRHPYAEHYMDRFEYGRVNSKSNPESIMEDKNRRGVTALMRAAESNPNPTIALVLIDAGAEIEAADKDGVTSLMRAAASNSNPEVVLALIDRGADLEAKDKKGMTPLMHAAANSGVRTFSRMIFRAKTQKLSAGLISRLKESESEYAKDSNSKVALALIDKGANLEAKDKKGMTPLMHAAASNTNPDVISALIEAGADAKAKNKSGKNALYYAKKNDYINKSEAYQDLKNAIKKKR